MTHAGFSLTTRWRFRAGIEEVAAVLDRPERFPDWWPEVYLGVKVLSEGAPDGSGRIVAFHTRGWLPYTLRWQARLVGADRPHRWTIEATGDLAGTGIWSLVEEGADTLATYDWRVRVEKPLLRPLTPLLAPIYAANHRWAMARGEAGMAGELIRRRADGEVSAALERWPRGAQASRRAIQSKSG